MNTRVARRAGTVLLALAAHACVAPTARPLALRPDERAYWLLVYDDASFVFVPTDTASSDADISTQREVVVLSATVSVPLVRRSPPPANILTRPYPRPRRILGITDGAWQPVPLADSAFARLRRPACPALVPREPLDPRASSNLAALLPFGDRLLLLAGRDLGNPVARARLALVSEELETYDPSLGAPPGERIALDGIASPRACSDGRGGAWLLDTTNALFHLSPGAPSRFLMRIPAQPEIVVSAMSCLPGAEPTRPEIFLRNYDYDVYYLAPGASRPVRTTFRRQFIGLTYPFERQVGVDTSVFESAGPRRVRAQFWSPFLIVAETATTADADGALPMIEIESESVRMANDPIKRSAYARSEDGVEVLVGERTSSVAPILNLGMVTFIRGGALPRWRDLGTNLLGTDARTILLADGVGFGALNGKLSVVAIDATQPTAPLRDCGRIEALGSADVLAWTGRTLYYGDASNARLLLRFEAEP